MLNPTTARRWGVAAVGAAASIVAAAPAYAHDSVIGAAPEDKSVVSEFPDKVTLEFSGEVQDGFNTIALSREVGGQSEVVYSGEPAVDGRYVTLDLPDNLDAEPGDYKVGFQIVSSDGHSTKGMTSFRYSEPGAESSAAATSAEASKDPAVDAAEDMGTTSKVLLVLLGVLVIAGAAVAALVKVRRTPGTHPSSKK